jgi:putative addiction module component (TIGR02574 family)
VATPSLKELLALDVETRLALVQKLWDSIVTDAQTGQTGQTGAEFPIADADRREFDDRLRENDAHPEHAIPWQEALARLRGQ